MSGTDFREYIAGVDHKICLPNGSWVTAVNLDNAATTPPFVRVLEEIVQFSPLYSSVHRGKGYKSCFSTELYESARVTVANFVKADLKHDTVIFLKNTTEAINKLSYRLCTDGEPGVVLSTAMEHHSNDLPWRGKYHVDYVDIDEAGRLSLDDLVYKLEKYKGRVKLVAVTGASNVTGYVNPINAIAEIAHKYGSKILVDGAQLVPHGEVDMLMADSPGHIDFLAFSAHKMYAPFGTGVLIGPREAFRQGAPEYVGGGTVRSVTRERVVWDEPPFREEAGTPNLMGAFGLHVAINVMLALGMGEINTHELQLWDYAMEHLREIPGMHIYCDTDANKPRIGIIPFNLTGIHHDLVADILAVEMGIAVRSGCFCAQPYVRKILKETRDKQACVRGYYSPHRPGMVRISFGLYNNIDEIDLLIQALQHISENKEYYLDKYAIG